MVRVALRTIGPTQAHPRYWLAMLARLTATLKVQFAESVRLGEVIRVNLRMVSYEY